jgi:hypothetical protein
MTLIAHALALGIGRRQTEVELRRWFEISIERGDAGRQAD